MSFKLSFACSDGEPCLQLTYALKVKMRIVMAPVKMQPIQSTVPSLLSRVCLMTRLIYRFRHYLPSGGGAKYLPKL